MLPVLLHQLNEGQGCLANPRREKLLAKNISVEPSKIGPPDSDASGRSDIPIDGLCELKICRIGGIRYRCDGPGKGIPVGHLYVNPLVPLEDQVKPITVAVDPPGTGYCIHLQAKVRCRIKQPEPLVSSPLVNEESDKFVLLLLRVELVSKLQDYRSFGGLVLQDDRGPDIGYKHPGKGPLSRDILRPVRFLRADGKPPQA